MTDLTTQVAAAAKLARENSTPIQEVVTCPAPYRALAFPHSDGGQRLACVNEAALTQPEVPGKPSAVQKPGVVGYSMLHVVGAAGVGLLAGVVLSRVV